MYFGLRPVLSYNRRTQTTSLPACQDFLGPPTNIHAVWHHHNLVARSKSIAVSTMRRQEGRSVARRNAEWSPRLRGLRSLSIVRSQDWRGRPLGRRQSTGRRSVDARSAREWSSEAAVRAICPNSLRRRCCISEETGDWSVCDSTDTLVTRVVYGTRRIRRKHHWSKASRRPQYDIERLNLVRLNVRSVACFRGQPCHCTLLKCVARFVSESWSC